MRVAACLSALLLLGSGPGVQAMMPSTRTKTPEDSALCGYDGQTRQASNST